MPVMLAIDRRENNRWIGKLEGGQLHIALAAFLTLILLALSPDDAFAKSGRNLVDQLAARLVSIRKAAEEGNRPALDNALRAVESLYPTLQRELPAAERPQVGIVVGTACKELAGTTKSAPVAASLRAAALDYFRRGADVAESLGMTQARYEALNGNIQVYYTINKVEFDGMRHYGSQQALIGLIPLLEAARQTVRAMHGSDNTSVGVLSLQLAHLRQSTRSAKAAIDDYEQSFAIFRDTKIGKGNVPREIRGAMIPYIWSSRLGLYELLMNRLQRDRAEETLRSLLPLFSEASDPGEYVEALNRLGMHFYYGGHGQTAIQYLDQAASFAKKRLPREALRIAAIEDNLAAAYLSAGDVEKAIDRNREAHQILTLAKRAEYSDDIIKIQNNYAAMLRRKGNYDSAIEVWASVLKERGWPQNADCLACGIQLFNMAQTMLERNEKRPDADVLVKAVSYAKASLEINLRLVGRELAQTADAYELLARAALASSDADAAISHTSEAIAIYKDLFAKSGLGRLEYAKAVRNAGLLKLRALWQSETPQDIKLKESFEAAQLVTWTRVAEALAQSLERTSGDNPRLVELLRSRQDLVQSRSALSARVSAAVVADVSARTKESATALRAARDELARVDAGLAENGQAISLLAPEVGEADVPSVMSLERVGAELASEAVLALFVSDTDATYVWVVDKSAGRWKRVALGSATLANKVQALRCGVDLEEWDGITRPMRCARLLGLTRRPAQKEPLPFDLALAHEMYKSLLGEMDEQIRDRHLFVIPAGPLTSLPFQVLVTATPTSARPRTFDEYKSVAWLIRRQPITVLPSVSSLGQHARARLTFDNRQPYLGYGDPVLVGSAACRPSTLPRDCRTASTHNLPWSATITEITSHSPSERRGVSLDRVYRNGASLDAVLPEVRALCPLHDTAFELRCVAQSLDAPADALRLGASATEASLKQLSQKGDLARYRVVHFATHGLLAGDTELLASRHGEPALVMTPPDNPKDDNDDGLLTASEVARLRLDADWVILSACNTAAGDEIGSEALSGMARAFFYAGARSLLVSHWPVYSDVAVQLLDRTFAELRQDKSMGRSEALRRAMVDLMDDLGQDDNPHPSIWAPFSLAGEGAQ